MNLRLCVHCSHFPQFYDCFRHRRCSAPFGTDSMQFQCRAMDEPATVWAEVESSWRRGVIVRHDSNVSNRHTRYVRISGSSLSTVILRD